MSALTHFKCMLAFSKHFSKLLNVTLEVEADNLFENQLL